MTGPLGGRPRFEPLPLTGGQLRILDRLSHGQGMPQIAREMDISVDTARRYLRTTMERLTAQTPTHAVAIAIRDGHLDQLTVGATDVR